MGCNMVALDIEPTVRQVLLLTRGRPATVFRRRQLANCKRSQFLLPLSAYILEVAIEKLVQAVTCIVRCLAVVFQPVTKQAHPGLEVRGAGRRKFDRTYFRSAMSEANTRRKIARRAVSRLLQ
jgi:hypothetical protein